MCVLIHPLCLNSSAKPKPYNYMNASLSRPLKACRSTVIPLPPLYNVASYSHVTIRNKAFSWGSIRTT